MKKLAIAAACAAALSAGIAHAYTTGTFSNGFVVPYVYHNGPTNTTAVGVTNNLSSKVAVHWVFFDKDSVHVRDGCFEMTANDFEPFIWSSPKNGSTQLDGSSFANKKGYLVFAVGTSSSGARDNSTSPESSCSNYDIYLPSSPSASAASIQAISGAAFHVNTGTNDVAYVPVIDGPLASTTSSSLSSSSNDIVDQVSGATSANATHYMRFYTAGGAKTEIVIWNSAAYNAKTQFGKVAFPFDDKQNNLGSVTLPIENKELNFFDPAPVVGSSTITDGFIKWTPMSSAGTSGVFTYSVINAPAFGALQSIINPYAK